MIALRAPEVQIWIKWFALRAPDVPEQNKINLIVEQNKYFNYYENKNVFKKKTTTVKYRKTISIIVKLTLFQRNIVKMQKHFLKYLYY